MHFAVRGYLLVALTALLAIAGMWADDSNLAGMWLLPAFLLLAGLAIEAWYLRGTRLTVQMRLDSRLKLGRRTRAAFGFLHNRGRELRLQYARVLPAALRQTEEVREIDLEPEEETRDAVELMPLRLG